MKEAKEIQKHEESQQAESECERDLNTISTKSQNIKECRKPSKLTQKSLSADNLKKKVKVLYPIQDEDASRCSFDITCYK